MSNLKSSLFLLFFTLFVTLSLKTQNKVLIVLNIPDMEDVRINAFFEDFLFFNDDVEIPSMGFAIRPLTQDTVFFCGQINKLSFEQDTVFFLSHGLQSYTHLIVKGGSILYVVNMKNSLNEILHNVQKYEIFNKRILDIITDLHRQNYFNRYFKEIIPGEFDENGEWNPCIEYDANKW